MFSFSKKKPAAPPRQPLTSDDTKRLEDAKHRLFAGLTVKKREKSSSPSRPSSSATSQRPTPPPRPPKNAAATSAFNMNSVDNQQPKAFTIPGLHLPALKCHVANERTLTFKRLLNGHFEFVLRRALAVHHYADGKIDQKTVVLVEPTHTNRSLGGSAIKSSSSNADQLLTVNGHRVEGMSREEVVNLIRQTDGDELSIVVKTLNSSEERNIMFKRLPNGEFAVVLRRSQIVDIVDDKEKANSVFLVEYTQKSATGLGALSVSQSASLLPGDQLLAVNGRAVENLSRDQLIEMLRSSEIGDSVTITVKSVPELAEVSGRVWDSELSEVCSGALTEADDRLTVCSMTTSNIRGRLRRKTEAVAAVSESGSSSSDSVWLVHRDGYASANVQNRSADGVKVRLLLTDAGDLTMEVDSADVETANPAVLDRAEDLGELLYLNEASVMHLLRHRYASNLIHTYAGCINTLIIKPRMPLAIYSDQIVQVIKSCRREDVPPHIYAVAQRSYRSMTSNRRSQAIVFTGRSGSGKTTQLKHLLNYLCVCANSVNKLFTLEKCAAMFNVLEAFGNCSTLTSPNASRFITMLTLDFDHIGQISAGLLHCLSLESRRIVEKKLPKEEGIFHVFYYLCCGGDRETMESLSLHNMDDGGFLGEHKQRYSGVDEANAAWKRLHSSLDCLAITADEQRSIFRVLGAIVHLAAAGATKGIPSFKSTFLKPIRAQNAAELLGVSLPDLQKAIFISTTPSEHQRESRQSVSSEHSIGSGESKLKKLRHAHPFRGGSLLLERLSITDKPGDGVEALDAFLIGVYKELFNLVVSLINRSLSSNYRTVTSMTLVDCPGYQTPTSRPAGFTEFCFNYANDRLAALYYDTVFVKEMECYRQEKIDIDFDVPAQSPSLAVSIIDKFSQHHGLKSTNLEARSQEKRGLLWLLDEESIFPGATDDSFLSRIFVHYGDKPETARYLNKGRYAGEFVFHHALGTYPVVYNVSGWLQLAQQNPVTRQALPLLQESTNSHISNLFLLLRSDGIAGSQQTESVFVESASARRTTALYKTLSMPQAAKRKSNCAMLKVQMDYLTEIVRRAGRTHFVHCFTPCLGDKAQMTQLDQQTHLLDIPLLRSQIRALQLTEAVRFEKIGFPERMLFGEFRRRFQCLASPQSTENKRPDAHLLLDDREAASRLLYSTLQVDASEATLGVGYVFMKQDLLAKLEDMRDQRLTDIVVKLQAQCRAYLSRQLLRKRRIQETAVCCIQKNINKYLAVQSWPWWRLFSRVLPLLSLQKSEESTKAQLEELGTLRNKLRALEKQHSELRLHCNRLEARLVETRSEVSDERGTVSQLTEALGEENKLRLRLEKELNDLNAAYAVAAKKAEKADIRALEYEKLKISQSSASLANEANPESESSVETLREKLAEARRLLDVERHKCEMDKSELQEKRRSLKQKSAKRESELEKELEEVREQASSDRRRSEKLRQELQDARVNAQQLAVRNAELEKRQRRFDAELETSRTETASERHSKERFAKEVQSLTTECLRLETDLRNDRDELDELRTKYSRASEELRLLTTEAGANGGKASGDSQLRLQKQNLERRCAEQEAELDEMSGEMQQLQQRITRLEMQNEKLRQENSHENERREEEIDQIRAQNQRRLRGLDEQLEEERHSVQVLQRRVRELEAQLKEANDSCLITRVDENETSALRHHLRHVKALLKDSQLMLEHYQQNAPNKGLVKQLKNQLEDAEAVKSSSVKIRQNLETELEELRASLTAYESAKSAAEDRCSQLTKERHLLENRISDLEDELQDLLKKYKAQVKQSNVDHITLTDQIQRLAVLEKENDILKDRISELTSQMEHKDASSVEKHKMQLAEAKIRDLEARLDLEIASKVRAEANCNRAKENIDSLKEKLHVLQAAKDRDADTMKRVQIQLNQQQDVLLSAQRREAEAVQRIHDLETTILRLEEENCQVVADLKLALRRIDDLQAALQDDDTNLGSDDDLEDNYSDYDDEESDEKKSTRVSHFSSSSSVQASS